MKGLALLLYNCYYVLYSVSRQIGTHFVYREKLTNLTTAVYLTETVFDGQYEC